MHIYDISLPISPAMPTWPGDSPIELQRTARMEDGEMCNITAMSMSVHTGTHVDAPYHFLGGDTLTVERMSLKTLSGRAYVLHLPDVDLITKEVLENADIPPRTRRLLFKTRNSALWADPTAPFFEDFVAISADGATYLVERGVKLIGVDYLSVAPFAASEPTHQILLKGGVVLVEGLDLSKVAQGRYTLHCLPLKLVASDGAPARAILIGV
ncbi:MAG: cyclase family protein [Chloroflexi bacterium]|nr:cyclase family protein [Chloroflexota bacterium]